jgi:dienelactone hydrolase
MLVTLWLAPARAEFHSLDVTSPANATLSGDLSLPRGPGPFPAVILLHGCGGIGRNIREWSYWLVHNGYAAFALDSFTGRRLRRLCGDPAPLTGAMRAPDVYAAARYLKTLGAIDGQRIAAIGFSHGGWTVLAAAVREDAHPEIALRGFIAFYPGCGGRRTLPGTAPILILTGGKDDWTPAAPCQPLADNSRAAGRDVTAVIYPEARHHFDGAEVRGIVFVPDARRGKGATVQYDPAAHGDSEKQILRFLKAHLAK